MDFRREKLGEIINRLEEDKVDFVRFELSDVYGVARSKIVPAVHFREKCTHGLPFNLAYLASDPLSNKDPESRYGYKGGCRDALMFPDYDTYIKIPWRKNMGRILIEPKLQDIEVAAHPRTLARRQLDRLNTMGYSLLSAFEDEFYLENKITNEPYTNATFIRATLRNEEDPELTHQLLTDLPKVGINVEVLESELLPGQVEISYKPSFGIKSADAAHTFRLSVKEIAKDHGYIASFMTKPWLTKQTGRNASHLNHSLWDAKGKNAVMVDENCHNGLSKVAQHWIAGILSHAPAIRVLMAPTVNCLSAYGAYSFAPLNATWGFDNRTTALRVKVDSSGGMYIENRIPSGLGNPYIVLAATVAAGIDGIKNHLEPPPDIKGDAYDPENLLPQTATFPTDMKTALEYFNSDTTIREALGEDFCKCFVGLKLLEMRLEEEAEAQGDITWQRKFFFEYL